MPLHASWAYGLRIHAELDCPELPPHSEKTGNPDVTIRLLPALSTGPKTFEERSHYEVQPGVFRLTIPDVARYRVEEGCRIFIEPLADAPIE